jgi:hypothetical protein
LQSGYEEAVDLAEDEDKRIDGDELVLELFGRDVAIERIPSMDLGTCISPSSLEQVIDVQDGRSNVV